MKRARYDGPSMAVEVQIPRSGDEAEFYSADSVIVPRGHLLPDDVPAKIRDELLERPDWAEVDQKPPAKKED